MAKKKKKQEAAPPSRRKMAPQPYVRIGFLVHDVSRMRRTLFDQAVKPLGITRAQWWALANLSREEEGIIQSELARVLDVGKVTVGGLLDRLEASKYIERRPDAQDRRLKRVYVTENGYDIMEEMARIGRNLNNVVMKDIPLDQLNLAEEVLHQMKVNMRALLKGEGENESDPEPA